MAAPEMESRLTVNQAAHVQVVEAGNTPKFTATHRQPLQPRALARSRGRSAEARLTQLIDPMHEAKHDPESRVRDLCNALYVLGFSSEYLEHRFRVSRRVA